ncbi:MAG: transposase, partial [Euryarchaeota archaeon]|nr:transposase [Euryarchaeota archaeon]
MTKLTRTVILESYPLTGRKFRAIAKLFNDYRGILEELVLIALENEIESRIKLRKLVYEDVKERYEGLPTHYIYTACQDAITRIKSFLRLKEGRDGQKTLFIRVSTRHGRITIPLKPHKLFFKYLSDGWKIRANVGLRIDYERRVVHAIFTFQKE